MLPHDPTGSNWLYITPLQRGTKHLDPLGGVGTVAFEAALLGRPAFSCDLSPFASTVARAKLAPPSSAELQIDLDAFSDALGNIVLTPEEESAADFGLNARVRDYYHPKTLDEVLKAQQLLGTIRLSVARNFTKACVLHILHGNRPYALSRISHPITPFSPSGPFELSTTAAKAADAV